MQRCSELMHAWPYPQEFFKENTVYRTTLSHTVIVSLIEKYGKVGLPLLLGNLLF